MAPQIDNDIRHRGGPSEAALFQGLEAKNQQRVYEQEPLAAEKNVFGWELQPHKCVSI